LAAATLALARPASGVAVLDMITRGIVIMLAFAAWYVAACLTLGWRESYDVLLGIRSPADTGVPVLAWPLSFAGWLIAPGVAGAVAGYVITMEIEMQRGRPVEQVVSQHQEDPGELIPLLTELPEVSDAEVGPGVDRTDFFIAYMKLHDGDPSRAQDHWERVVQSVLATDAVDPDASGSRAIAQAVTASVTLLNRFATLGRCPRCPVPAPEPTPTEPSPQSAEEGVS
jgi:uncharacterized protein DUF6313